MSKIVPFERSFAFKYPQHLCAWVDPRDPKEAFENSEKKYWFKCLKNSNHPDYEQVLRVKGKLGCGCPYCDGKRIYFGNSLAGLFPDIAKEYDNEKNEKKSDQISPGSHKKVWWIHFCGHEWLATVKSRTEGGNGCPKCSNVQRQKTKRIAKKGKSVAEKYPEILDMWVDPRDPYSVYLGTHEKYYFKCLKNENHKVYVSTPQNIFAGNRCPSCSHAFTRLEEFVCQKLNIQRFNQKAIDIDSSFYKPDFKLSEELFLDCDGLYWHSEAEKDNDYHFKKRINYEKNDKRVLQFYEDEIYHKWPIIESMVNNALKKNINKIMARKCTIDLLSSSEAKAFFNNNHLMGHYSAATTIGLRENTTNELVACVSYRTLPKRGMIEISRFSSKINTVVMGGFQKLLEIVKDRAKELKIGKIVSFCDLRYATGASYHKAGFKLDKVTQGWCWTDGKQRFNRLKCVAMPGKTERENAIEKKWYRLYDAGQAKYVLTVA